MAEQSLKDKIVEVESLHQHYLDLRENTLQMKRNGEECKAYHKWYDAAYVFFSSIKELKGTNDFNAFVSAKKDGNCFVLEHIYDSISASYRVLMNRAREMKTQEIGEVSIRMQASIHMKKIYQIFVSSTFEDLKMERQEVMAAVVSTGNVPIGMEYFPAGNASPFEYIKQQIDGADYYILIVAGKYGSINDKTGISYTEMEFDYAVSKGIPIAVLLYKDIEQLKGVQLENTDTRRGKLETFRRKASQGRMVALWEDAKDLKLKVKEAIDNLIKNSPRTGWIRADQAVVDQQESLDENLLRTSIEFVFDDQRDPFALSDGTPQVPLLVTIKDLLSVVVPVISTPKTESAIDVAFDTAYPNIKEESLMAVKACLLKYKLIETNTLILPNDGIYTAWSVTPLGRSLWAQSYGM